MHGESERLHCRIVLRGHWTGSTTIVAFDGRWEWARYSGHLGIRSEWEDCSVAVFRTSFRVFVVGDITAQGMEMREHHH